GVSPLRTLQRGYSLALKEDGSVISNEKTVSPGEKINIRLSKGALTCKILNKEISHDKTT
ncbi:MAG: exodeoxyribonuclease VII large subunit, partial [Gammaproteobacteria bacterium]